MALLWSAENHSSPAGVACVHRDYGHLFFELQVMVKRVFDSAISAVGLDGIFGPASFHDDAQSYSPELSSTTSEVISKHPRIAPAQSQSTLSVRVQQMTARSPRISNLSDSFGDMRVKNQAWPIETRRRVFQDGQDETIRDGKSELNTSVTSTRIPRDCSPVAWAALNGRDSIASGSENAAPRL
jgi:hypothetical protein